MAKCKGCGADIEWLKTINGKSMPCDAQPVPVLPCREEKKKYLTSDGLLIPGLEVGAWAEGVELAYVPHWSSCPSAKEFKK